MTARKIERNAAIVADRAAGVSVKALAEKYGVGRVRIEQILARDGDGPLGPRRTVEQHRKAVGPAGPSVRRTILSCPCFRCVAEREHRRAQWAGRRTGAFDLAAYPHIEAVLDALAG